MRAPRGCEQSIRCLPCELDIVWENAEVNYTLKNKLRSVLHADLARYSTVRKRTANAASPKGSSSVISLKVNTTL